jgi:hypothetical protein
MSPLDQLIEELSDRIAARLAERLRAGEPGWIQQADSPLGRRHCAVVRGRLARGEGGASIIGRRHLLSPAALGEEIERCSGERRASATSDRVAEASASVRGELERELRIVRGRGRR